MGHGAGFLGPFLVQPTAPSERHRQQRLGLERELHRQFVQHGLAKPPTISAVASWGDAALLQEQALLGDARGGGLVLDHGVAAGVDVGEGVRAAVGPDQQRIALRVVARAGGPGAMRTRPR